MPIIDRIRELHGEMTAWRRDIHAHPETAFEEHRTVAGRRGAAHRVRPGSPSRTGEDRRRRQPARRQRQARDRPARRPGRAAHPRAERFRAPLELRRPDARVRPRRPHDDAARRGEVPRGDAQLRRHDPLHLPAGRGERRRRARDGRGGSVREVSLRGRLRHAQLAGHAGRAVRRDAGPGDGVVRHLRDRDHRPRRARRDAAHTGSTRSSPARRSSRRCRPSRAAT